jgi:hypothetical protein
VYLLWPPFPEFSLTTHRDWHYHISSHLFLGYI